MNFYWLDIKGKVCKSRVSYQHEGITVGQFKWNSLFLLFFLSIYFPAFLCTWDFVCSCSLEKIQLMYCTLIVNVYIP